MNSESPDLSAQSVARASRPKRRKAIRAQEMLSAARKVFSEKGFEAASISEIARAADCVEGTIYTYFEGKRALLDAVLAAYYDELIADIAPRLAAIAGTEDRLCFLMARHLRIPLEDPGVARLIMVQSKAPDEYFGSPLHGLNKRYSRFLTDTLEQGKTRGEIRSDVDSSLVRDMIFGGIAHWTWNATQRRRNYDAARVARQMLATLFPGLRTAAPAIPADVEGRDESLRAISARLARIESLVATGVKSP